MQRYRTIIPVLARAGIAFRPMVWTADGRPHVQATRTLKYGAELAARKSSGRVSARELYAAWTHEIT
eukprot:2619158-Prorocentrum_lima.AAC.1